LPSAPVPGPEIRYSARATEVTLIELSKHLRKRELMLYADAMIAREHVKMKGELSIFIPGRDFKLYLTSSLDYEIPTYNATEKHARQVYDIAIRNLCLEMVKQIQEEMGTGGAKS
jgi:hypothetical protein